MSSEESSIKPTVVSDSMKLKPKKSSNSSSSNDSKTVPKNESKEQKQKLKESKESGQLVVNVSDNKVESDTESVESTWVNFVDNYQRPNVQKPKSIDSYEETKRKILNKEIDGHIIIYEPKGPKYQPMKAIDRLVYSHLRTHMTDKTIQPMAEFGTDEREKSNTIAMNAEPHKVSGDNIQAIDHVTAGIPDWMLKPKDKSYNRDRIRVGLECVDKLRKFYIYDNIKMIDRMFDKSLTNNCMTLRNADFQQLFHIGPKDNHSNSTYRPFTLMVVDQYCRQVMVIKKHWKSFCCGRFVADIECPPEEPIGHLKQTRFLIDKTVEFVILDPRTKKKRFIVTRMGAANVRHEFDILNASNESIGNIIKRFDKLLLNGVVKEDHHIRVSVPQVIAPEDKALLIAAGVIINIFFLRKFKTIETK